MKTFKSLNTPMGRILVFSSMVAFSLLVVISGLAATMGAWTSLNGPGSGLDNYVEKLLMNGGVLYAIGGFSDAGGDADADKVAKFQSGSWSSLNGAGSGFSGSPISMAMNGGTLYVGGFFSDAGGDADADNIAKFQGGVWTSLNGAGTGLNSTVNALLWDGATLYASGNFTDAGGDPDADYIAKFDGTSWSSLGGAGTGLSSQTIALAMDGGVLYAAGFFADAGGDADADRIAKFESGAWSSLNGAGTSLNDTSRVLLVNGGNLYAGGNFTDAGGDGDADYIAKFDGSSWSSLGGAGTGLNDSVWTIVVDSGVIYAGGDFTNAGGDADADMVAKFDGGVWSSLNGAGTDLNGRADTFLINSGVLYAGGNFTDAGGDADADYIAQFGLSEVAGQSDNSTGGGETTSKEIASTGTTTLQVGRLFVSVPANAIPAGETNCRIVVKSAGESGTYGFELDDAVWDVSIACDSGKLSILFAPISVCIRPQDGVTTNKQVFHRHGGGTFTALASTGEKSGYVCGHTQTLSLFTLGLVSLPDTGFSPGVVTLLPKQPADLAYTASDLMLNIPSLGLEMDIVGVPQGPNGWDVSWLGDNAGYLNGTAFPTMAGNTVLTAHVWNADNTPGPFAALDQLQYGDLFSISAWGNTYTYEVRTNSLVSPNSVRPLAHQMYDWVTLITCQYFDESTGEYALRRVVQAVLVSVD